MICMVEDMTVGEAIRRIKEFALHHAVQELPNSARTVEAFGMAITALEVVSKIVTCGECQHHIAYRCRNDMMLWTHRCKLGHGTLGDDWFCADGERKENRNERTET